MPRPKRIVIVAGEESGDIHAAHLVGELLAGDPTLQISGIGGQHMQTAGVALVSDLARHGVTGLTEVIRHLRVIRQAFIAIKKHLATIKPDLLILVDYPGFNLRLAKFAKQVLGLRIIYYISPQLWAWKANRIHIIRSCIDRMAVILPFEKTIYEKAGIPVSFVGHPLLKKIPTYHDLTQVRRQLNVPIDKKLVAILPGSRRNEIEHHLPILVETAIKLTATMPHLHFVIAVAGSLPNGLIESYFKQASLNISFIVGQTLDVVACSDCVVVASGTASLECALLQKPMCIIYKTSRLTYMAAVKVINVKYLGLCNLLQGSMIVPELLQYDCNAHELTLILQQLLTNQQVIAKMISRLALLKQSLSLEKADHSLTDLIKHELNPSIPLGIESINF